MRRRPDPAPPRATRAFARLLPRQVRWLACAGVHTYSDAHDGCLVCGHQMLPVRIRALSVRGTRTARYGTSVHLHLTKAAALNRLQWSSGCIYWLATWTRAGDRHEARLRPHVSFGHRNVSRQHRLEREPDLVFDET